MKWTRLVVALGIVGLSASAGAQKKGKPGSSDTAVTLTFRLNGQQLGDKFSNVGSRDYRGNIVSDGRLLVSTARGSGNEAREVQFWFDDCAESGNCQIPPSWQFPLRTEFDLITVAAVDSSGAQTGFLDMIPGMLYSARMKIGFPDPGGKKGNGGTWQVRFDGESYEGSTDIDVTRTSETTWQIVSRTGDHTAKLVNSPDVDHGSYYLPFELTVTKP
jgi:hypothetical protein